MIFPNDFRRNAISNQLHAQYGQKNNQELNALNISISVAGRMIARRIMGKATFVVLQDMGGKIQLYVSYNNLSTEYYEKFLKWDIGDILGACGILFKTRTGELSLRCHEIRLLTKALRSFPDKFHGILNQELRYRKRYLDLITNDVSRGIFKTRSLVISEIRHFMKENDFMEVETPMIHPIPGGAEARPFVTHYHALNTDMYLRIAPELYLKKLVIGGFEKIFEINRNFRNEGISSHHNPEFTMMELYMAYSDYHDLMILTENLLRHIIIKVLNTNVIQYRNITLDLDKPFTKMKMKEAICFYHPNINSEDLDSVKSAILIANSLDIPINKNWGLGRIQTKIFEKTTVHYLIQPTFIINYPTEVSPLARCNDFNPSVTDRFELFIAGYEIGNGFSELNDSEEQKNRFHEQSALKNFSDEEIMLYDSDYITALEYGLPPTAGLGIGIDRLMMLLTNSRNIRDVILFPILKSKSNI